MNPGANASATRPVLPLSNLPTVHLVDTNEGVTEISENGPVSADGIIRWTLMISATGFEVQVTGISRHPSARRLELNEKIREGMRTVFGIHS